MTSFYQSQMLTRVLTIKPILIDILTIKLTLRLTLTQRTPLIPTRKGQMTSYLTDGNVHVTGRGNESADDPQLTKSMCDCINSAPHR